MWKLFTNFKKQVSVERYELDRHHTHGDVDLARVSYCFHGKFKHLSLDGHNVWRILGKGACCEYLSWSQESFLSLTLLGMPALGPVKCLPLVLGTQLATPSSLALTLDLIREHHEKALSPFDWPNIQVQNKRRQSSSFIHSTNIKNSPSAGNASVDKTDKTPALARLIFWWDNR